MSLAGFKSGLSSKMWSKKELMSFIELSSQTRKSGFKHLMMEMLMHLQPYFLSQISDIKILRLDYSFVWMGGYPGKMIKHSLLSRNGVLTTFDSLQSVDYGGNAPPPEQWEPIMSKPMPDGFPLPYN